MRRFKWWYGLIAAAAVLVVAAAVLFLPRLFGASGDEGHGLLNGDFSQLDESGMPLYWTRDGYGNLSDVTFQVERQEDGGNVAHISSRTLHDARFAQQAAVEPDTLYCLHGWIKADAESGLGANLSIAGVYSFSDSVFDSQGEWREVSLYGRTREDQTAVTVFVRLGGYSGEAQGDAWFKEISLQPVASVPEGSSVLYWGVSSASADSGANNAPSAGEGLLILCTLVWAALFCLLLGFFRRQEEAPVSLSPDCSFYERHPWRAFLLLMAVGLGVRITVSLLVPGYDVDIGCFSGWGSRMAAVGPTRFYEDYFCDYPPGYLLVLWLLGGLGNLFRTGVTEFMVKIPPILADLALCALLFREARRHMSARAALSLVTLYLLNPLILVTGAAWGQADAVMVVLLALTVLFAVRKNWIAALPCYVAAVLVKPQALMFGPLGLAALILYIREERRQGVQGRKTALRLLAAAAAALAVAAAVVLPFSVRQSWDWLIRLYGKTMSYYDRATVNGCNLYFLLGQNWNYIAVNISAQPLIPLLAYGLIALPMIGVWLKRLLADQEPLLSPFSVLRLEVLGGIALAHGLYLLVTAAAGRLTFSSLGTAMISLCVMLTCAQFVLSRDLRNLPIYGAICLLALFNTGVMMHERYLVPAVALLLLGYALQEKKDNRILWLAAGVTVTGFLNVACVLNRNIRIGGVSGHLDAPLMGIYSDLALLEYAASVLNMVICALAVAYGCVLCHAPAVRSRRVPERVRRGALVGAVTAVYAVLAFTNLGSTKAPQTAWVASSPDEQVTLDLGGNYSFHLAYFGGIHQFDSDFTVEVSADGRNWDVGYTAGMKIGDCFKWKYLSDSVQGVEPVDLYGRYIRITADHYDLTLLEALALDSFTHTPLPMDPVSDLSQAGALTDEPGSEAPQSAWRAAMPGDQVVLDLGEEQFFHLSYYGEGSAADTAFTLEISDDLENWQAYSAPLEYDQAFQWQRLEDNGEAIRLWGRYIRLTAAQEDLTLCEVAASNPWTDEALPLQVAQARGAALALVDEPGTMEGEPGWFNSTYFDEIYHARTGYELLHGMQPYEWTHPPLGKVLMSWCIALFGMTPFGWRFAGALAGVLMLPGMYLLGQMLTKKRWGGAAAMLLMALDLMHFTQTRIATIDSFVVLFIIWMVYFMLRWFQLDFFCMKLWKTLVPLFLSGLMLGFAIASKWTGVYAAVGIAIIFFWGLFHRIRQIYLARLVPVAARSDRVQSAADGWPRVLITVGCCFIFFIFIPLLIYYASYIPFFGKYDPEGISVVKVIQQAVGTYFTDGAIGGMLGYHSQPGLGMDHYFYSPWYQWPIIGKPMWYASQSFETEGFQSSIMALGNPAVWWTGLIALLAVLCLWVRRHVRADYTLALHPRERDPRYGLLLICFFSQYLPWMLVPRGTYIYHYFPLVPFIILCTVFCLDLLAERHSKAVRISLWVLLCVAAVLMIAFFPYASGIETPQAWMDAVKWFRNWLWY